MPGIGVCQVIVDAFSQPSALTANTTQNHTRSHSTNHTVHQALTSVSQGIQPLATSQDSVKHSLNHPHYVAQKLALPVALHSSQPAPVDHHFSHMSCGFCVLYGHAIPPPEPPALLTLIEVEVYSATPQFSNYNASIFAADYLTPNTRAPPLLILV